MTCRSKSSEQHGAFDQSSGRRDDYITASGLPSVCNGVSNKQLPGRHKSKNSCSNHQVGFGYPQKPR